MVTPHQISPVSVALALAIVALPPDKEGIRKTGGHGRPAR